MGRPPKTYATLASLGNGTGSPSVGLTAEDPSLAYSTPDALGALEASNMCPAIYKTFMQNTYDIRPGPFMSDGPLSGSSGFLPNATLEPPTATPAATIPREIDYSSISSMLTPTPGMTPSTSTDTNITSSTNTSSNTTSSGPSGFPQILAPCPCLSHLYLSLSSLATLNSFPLSPNTLITLYNASKTAIGVLRCNVCPTAYSSAVQNLMLLGTLLTCIANSWLEMSLRDGQQLAIETLDRSSLDSLPADEAARTVYFRNWLRELVRYGVIGHATPPNAPLVQSQCEESPNLLGLVEEMEARQRRWHAERLPMVNPSCPREDENGSPSNNAAATSTDGTTIEPKDPDFLCLRIAGNARQIIERLGFSAEELRNRN
ncbi:C6 finger domain protein, putative [Trichophyton verrucosum HKI 0517]|uniref:C6 finger domain protein, putative n=1 Tax=Trichophyton verrucosum (strain HKI 0517) TaxID=663202 RepID=D4DBU5_TRIVH|nr:C6 finger domain protein, putative [Trichophyton verrucosum HKI 0517]EFE40665.1 C6 finger domain protein, putative [Trichophyton verrucosum HKI 0517]